MDYKVIDNFLDKDLFKQAKKMYSDYEQIYGAF